MTLEQTLTIPVDAQIGSLRDVPAKSKGEGQVTQERLINPSSLIKLFEPNAEKLKALAKHLMENKYSLSDELRNYDIIHGILRNYLSSPNCIFYEIGDMDGVFGFTDITFSWKGHVIFELLNPRPWIWNWHR